jgi:hypothetical protein
MRLVERFAYLLRMHWSLAEVMLIIFHIANRRCRAVSYLQIGILVSVLHAIGHQVVMDLMKCKNVISPNCFSPLKSNCTLVHVPVI